MLLISGGKEGINFVDSPKRVDQRKASSVSSVKSARSANQRAKNIHQGSCDLRDLWEIF
ncbi:MAG: hypothetical protein LBE92_13610 [Chryseobacterium sp.]|jgi:hypothetical protein|uniref:hypothetical protein n=1 Tax=Chryseobacterium sp. TaxID=1871047 RepID=UPI0028182FC3|nr:hypothetical protein [Chryseobacterium sp.]MDR2237153.1 hypothetical protein [Chryseobacterium sp.]